MYVLEWLLGSPPAVFPRGELVLSVGWPLFAGAVALAGLAVWFLLGYRDHGQRLDWPGRLLLTVVRTGALALVLLCLLRPQLVLSRVIPQENLVGVLLDDSASMRIRDLARGEESRAEALLRTFEGNGPGAGDLGTALSGQFVTRLFRFSESVERVASASGLSFAGVRTDLAAALADISNELASLPLAGIVLLPDGAAAGGEALTCPPPRRR